MAQVSMTAFTVTLNWCHGWEFKGKWHHLKGHKFFFFFFSCNFYSRWSRTMDYWQVTCLFTVQRLFSAAHIKVPHWTVGCQVIQVKAVTSCCGLIEMVIILPWHLNCPCAMHILFSFSWSGRNSLCGPDSPFLPPLFGYSDGILSAQLEIFSIRLYCMDSGICFFFFFSVNLQADWKKWSNSASRPA